MAKRGRPRKPRPMTVREALDQPVPLGTVLLLISGGDPTIVKFLEAVDWSDPFTRHTDHADDTLNQVQHIITTFMEDLKNA